MDAFRSLSRVVGLAGVALLLGGGGCADEPAEREVAPASLPAAHGDRVLVLGGLELDLDAAVIAPQMVGIVTRHLVLTGLVLLLAVALAATLMQVLRAGERLEARLLKAQKMESLGRMAGGLAHDFNNLLTSVLGFATLGVKRTPRPEVAARFFDQIRQAADRIGFDLLITDVEMPRLRGPALAQRLVGENPGLRVLLISGYTEARLDGADLAAKGRSFLGKPFSPNEFMTRVAELLPGRGDHHV